MTEQNQVKKKSLMDMSPEDLQAMLKDNDSRKQEQSGRDLSQDMLSVFPLSK